MADFMRLVAPAYVHDPDKVELVLETWGRSTFAQEVAAHYFRNLAGLYDVRDQLGEIRAPTLVVVGEHDWLVPPSARRVIAEGIPGAELVVIPEAGHFSFIERSEAYADAVRRFLNVWCELSSPVQQVGEGELGTPELFIEPDTEVVQRQGIAANRARNPLMSWGLSRRRAKVLWSLS